MCDAPSSKGGNWAPDGTIYFGCYDFALYALTPTRGRAFIDDVSRFQWLSMVFLVLGAVQLVAAYFLRQRTNGR